MNAFAERWNAPYGYRHILRLGLPLMASMASATVTQFTDRMFLAHYSLDALAASLSGSITNFTLMAFFAGVIGYVNVFVAQYTGAGRHDRLGAVLWQGIWMSLFFGAFVALMSLPAEWFFALVGHSPAVQAMEASYYRILCLGAVLNFLTVGMSTFYSGRGMTRPVMLVNMAGAALNIPLDYALINGAWGLPELGIRGAGWATIISWGFSVALFALLIFRHKHEQRHKTRSAWRLDPALMRRLLSFGVPGGVELFLDLFGFMAFILIVGRIGTNELAATNMVFSLNHFSFLPMIGLNIAAETLVGQTMGAGKPKNGIRVGTNTVHLCVLWGAMVGAVFLLAPGPLLAAFKPASFTAAQYAPIAATGRVLLIFVAFYTLFDGIAIAYSGALKGAGDTRFVMMLSVVFSIFVMVLPCYVIVEVLHLGLYHAWACVMAYLVLYAGGTWLRFRAGKWQHIKMVRGKEE